MSNAKPTPPVFESDAAQASLICPPDVPGGFLTRGALIAGIVLISALFILPRAFPAADHWIGVQIALGTGFLLVLLYGVWCVHSGGRLHRRHGVANPLAADAGGDGGYGAGVGAAASADESAGLSEGVSAGAGAGIGVAARSLAPVLRCTRPRRRVAGRYALGATLAVVALAMLIPVFMGAPLGRVLAFVPLVLQAAVFSAALNWPALLVFAGIWLLVRGLWPNDGFDVASEGLPAIDGSLSAGDGSRAVADGNQAVVDGNQAVAEAPAIPYRDRLVLWVSVAVLAGLGILPVLTAGSGVNWVLNVGLFILQYWWAMVFLGWFGVAMSRRLRAAHAVVPQRGWRRRALAAGTVVLVCLLVAATVQMLMYASACTTPSIKGYDTAAEWCRTGWWWFRFWL